MFSLVHAKGHLRINDNPEVACVTIAKEESAHRIFTRGIHLAPLPTICCV